MRDRIRANLKISFISLVALAIVSYAYFETWEVITGPIIEISSPQNGYSPKGDTIEISGTVKNVSYMYLNGRPIFADTSGNFREKIILAAGYNSIYFEAQDRIGKKISKTLEVVFNTNKASVIESLAKEDQVPLSL